MFWKTFKSVKLAVFLLITLAAVAIIGTIIPQGEESVRFAMRLKPGMLRIFNTFGLFDVYHTFWFRTLLALLALNIIICSIDRFPKTWKRIKASPPVDMEKPFKNVDGDNIIKMKGKMEDIAESIKGFLKKRAGNFKSKIQENESFFYFEEGAYSHLGVYVVHLSVIIILAGGIIGSICGFEGYMNILEGEKKNIVRLARNSRFLKLNFYVKCNKFVVDYYKNGMPKEYMSELTFIENHKQIKKTLRVNHPVKFQGITFYQASYGIALGDEVFLKIKNNSSGRSFDIKLGVGKSYKLPDTGAVIRLVDIKGDFATAGPAAVFSILLPDGKEKKLILLKDTELAKKRLPPSMLNASIFNPSSVNPYTFIIKDIPARYYTGLQVSRDPGVPFVWTGFFLLVIGLMITFFTSHRRIWIRITKKGDKDLEIAVAGMSSRDSAFLSRRIKSILNEIKEEVKFNV